MEACTTYNVYRYIFLKIAMIINIVPHFQSLIYHLLMQRQIYCRTRFESNEFLLARKRLMEFGVYVFVCWIFFLQPFPLVIGWLKSILCVSMISNWVKIKNLKNKPTSAWYSRLNWIRDTERENIIHFQNIQFPFNVI